MPLPPVDVRPYRPADAPAVVAFFASAHRGDRAVRAVPAAMWRAYLANASTRRGRDFAVAVEGKRMVGILVSFAVRGRKRRHFRIVVHPARRRRGIGSALLRVLQGQPCPGPRPAYQTVLPGNWRYARAFYRHRGFRVVDRDVEMRREDRIAPPARVPPGYAIRPFGRPGDASAWNRLFREAWGRDPLVPTSTAASTRWERSLPGARSWMAVRRGRAVGLCLVHRADGAARVQSIAVAGAHRGRGLGRALLRTGVLALRESGRGPVFLSTGERNAGARGLYASEGFRAIRRDDFLWRDR